MGSGTPALRREVIRRLKREGVDVLNAGTTGGGHLCFAVRLPDGREIELTTGASPTDIHVAVEKTIRTLRRYYMTKGAA